MAFWKGMTACPVPKGVSADRQWRQIRVKTKIVGIIVPKGVSADRQWRLSLNLPARLARLVPKGVSADRQWRPHCSDVEYKAVQSRKG